MSIDDIGGHMLLPSKLLPEGIMWQITAHGEMILNIKMIYELWKQAENISSPPQGGTQ